MKIEKKTKAYLLVNNLLSELNDRSGFDNWWDDLDTNIKLEIKEELANIILKFYDEN